VAYVSGFGGTDARVWHVYRAGQPLVDPDNQRTLGFEAVFLGTARVTRDGEPATVQIVNSKKEIPREIDSFPRPRRPSPVCASCAEFRDKRANHGTLRCARYQHGWTRFDHLHHRGRRDGLESDTCSPFTATS